MPAYKPTEEEMERSLRETGTGCGIRVRSIQGSARSIDEEEESNPTALLPVSSLGGNVKVGDSVTVRVVKVYDDEAEVEITSGNSKPVKAGPATDMSANEELDSMNEG